MHVVDDGAGALTVERTDEADHVPFSVHGPAGLPDQLQVWFILVDGTRELAATLALDLAAIGNDLDLAQFDDEPTLAAGQLPDGGGFRTGEPSRWASAWTSTSGWCRRHSTR